jgi:YidC/Oxa1 family membrane protein insertase
LLQFPIFLALFKVLSVTIEMRHAPFFGWIHDLSARDPTSIFNLFGLIPWTPPQTLMIGGWSCMMFCAMWAQRQLSPPVQDKIQDAQMAFMPFFITWLMSAAPAGLVIYWAVSNSLSVLQQYVIMRSMGAPVNLLTRTRKKREMREMIKKGPEVHPELIKAEKDLEKALFGDDQPAEDGAEKAEEEQVSTGISAPKPKKKKKR